MFKTFRFCSFNVALLFQSISMLHSMFSCVLRCEIDPKTGHQCRSPSFQYDILSKVGDESRMGSTLFLLPPHVKLPWQGRIL